MKNIMTENLRDHCIHGKSEKTYYVTFPECRGANITTYVWGTRVTKPLIGGEALTALNEMLFRFTISQVVEAGDCIVRAVNAALMNKTKESVVGVLWLNMSCASPICTPVYVHAIHDNSYLISHPGQEQEPKWYINSDKRSSFYEKAYIQDITDVLNDDDVKELIRPRTGKA